MLKVLGAEIVKSGGCGLVTVSEIVPVWVMLPPTACTVMVWFETRGAVGDALRMMFVLPDVLMVTKGSDAPTPEGRPETESVTVPVKPFKGTTRMKPLLSEVPALSARLAGETTSEKSG